MDLVFNQDLAYAESLRIDKEKERLREEKQLKMDKVLEIRNKLLCRYREDMKRRVRRTVQLRVDCWGTTMLNVVLLPRHTLNILVAILLAELDVMAEIESFVDPVSRRVLPVSSFGRMSLRKLGILFPQRLIARLVEPS